jgi:hypothetical protein
MWNADDFRVVAITAFVAWRARCPTCEINPNVSKKFTLLLRLRFVLECSHSFPEIEWRNHDGTR